MRSRSHLPRTGTLWDSRYKSSLIPAETYLLRCQRYIELNPVRVGIVTDPAYYGWSSYRFHALGQANPYLSPHPLYLALGYDEQIPQLAYRGLFRTGLDDEAISDIRLAIQQSQPLGSLRFYANIEAMTGQRRKPRPRGRPRTKPDEQPVQEAAQGELRL